jgi:NAD(P)-dependent dehydrogenase (short-subunit alcohol dehydrogenase family)
MRRIVLAHLVGGFAGGQTIAQVDDSTWQRMFDMNLNSAFYLLRAVIPHMRESAADASSRLEAERRKSRGRKLGVQRIEGGAGFSDSNGFAGE